eukprot:5349075-Alexandrium_andersonii.AAC.1
MRVCTRACREDRRRAPWGPHRCSTPAACARVPGASRTPTERMQVTRYPSRPTPNPEAIHNTTECPIEYCLSPLWLSAWWLRVRAAWACCIACAQACVDASV